MNRFPSSVGALGLLVLSVTAGCGAPTQVVPSGRTSWVSPEAKNAREILFESDSGYESVEMFSLPNLKLVGVLTGIEGPAGMCSDSNGNVYVVTQDVPFAAVEISHEGKILRSVSDFYAYPGSCAVNPRNGDLAVANIEGDSQQGMVSLYPGGASGYDRWLRCSVLPAYYFVGFDSKGNIFADGIDKSDHFHLCRGKDGNVTMTEVKIAGSTINTPGMIEWYEPGKYLAVGDQRCSGSNSSCIYKVSISRDTGRVIGVTKPLNRDGSAVCDLYQGTIDAQGELLGGSNPTDCSGQTASVDVWPYPSGGVPSKHYGNTNFINEPTGAAVSVSGGAGKRVRPWMLPEAKSHDLLYVSDPPIVRVYEYPRAKLVGTIKPAQQAGNLCASAATGDVFFVELSQIEEYAHGGTEPIQTLKFPDYDAFWCAVDARSGNLAVTDAAYNGGIYVYPNASGTPKLYPSPPGVGGPDACVYDDRGNLYVTGGSPSFALGEISKTGKEFAIPLGTTPTEPAWQPGVQWDGADIALSDGAQNLYRFKIVRHTGVLDSQATLGDATSVFGMWVDGARLIIPNRHQYRGSVQFYAYPGGGAPTKTMNGFYAPFGVTVSAASK